MYHFFPENLAPKIIFQLLIIFLNAFYLLFSLLLFLAFHSSLGSLFFLLKFFFSLFNEVINLISLCMGMSLFYLLFRLILYV